MIEINLLPVEFRKTEGTPTPRLAGIFLSVALACGVSVFIAKYYFVEIPDMIQKIKFAKSDIEELEKKKIIVDNIKSEIKNLYQKVAALDNLNQSRIRHARVLDRLCNATPDGVWFRTFSIIPDNANIPSITPAGKRYQISLTGYTTGSNELEMNKKLKELIISLENEFGVLQDKDKPAKGQLPPPNIGFSEFLGLRFDKPQYLQGNFIPRLPDPVVSDPKILKQINTPTQGLDFSLKLGFQLPAPKAEF